VRAAHAINSGAFLPSDIREQRYDPSLNELRVIASPDAATEVPSDPELKPDCLWVSLPSETNASVEAVLEHVLTDILPERGFTSNDLQVLSPMRRGVASTGSLNNWLQKSLNPHCESKAEVTVGSFYGDITFREGDRVLQQRNDYDKEVFNGDLGIIRRIEDKDGTATVSFGADFKEVSYTKSELRDLIPAYAMTIHKAQGSEYKAVVLVLTNAHKPLLRRELLYTGVTRAKELLVIIAPRSALSSAIDAHGVDRRCTGLVDRLSAPVAARPSKLNNPR
jgi:exodeoxyribonuclease V alpha subunit